MFSINSCSIQHIKVYMRSGVNSSSFKMADTTWEYGNGSVALTNYRLDDLITSERWLNCTILRLLHETVGCS